MVRGTQRYACVNMWLDVGKDVPLVKLWLGVGKGCAPCKIVVRGRQRYACVNMWLEVHKGMPV